MLTNDFQETRRSDNRDPVKGVHNQQILVSIYEAIGAPHYRCLQQLVVVGIAASFQCSGYFDQDGG